MIFLSTGWKIAIICASAFLVLSISCALFFVLLISYLVFKGVLVKDKKEKWGTSCSEPTDPDLPIMWEIGLKWSEENKQYCNEIYITNPEHLKLHAEFYNFGFKKTVVILPGRCECLKYSYFYAFPYKDSGCNVLVIDSRAHGESEGKYNTAGIKEGKDLNLWIDYVSKKFNQESFIIHSICVGGSTGLLAYEYQKENSKIKAMIFDGIFVSFVETFARHMEDQGHSSKSPIFCSIWLWFFLKNGVSIRKAKPLKYIKHIDLPVLFLSGKEDTFSLPNKTELIFNSCSSKNKEIHWFEKGKHSRFRYVNPVEYDAKVAEFVRRVG